MHQNCRRSKTVMNALLNSVDPAEYDIICITEPYIYPKQRITTASPNGSYSILMVQPDHAP
jgi:hypothetical protein